MNSGHNRQNCTGSVIASRHTWRPKLSGTRADKDTASVALRGREGDSEDNGLSHMVVTYIIQHKHMEQKQIFRMHATAKLHLHEDTMSQTITAKCEQSLLSKLENVYVA